MAPEELEEIAAQHPWLRDWIREYSGRRTVSDRAMLGAAHRLIDAVRAERSTGERVVERLTESHQREVDRLERGRQRLEQYRVGAELALERERSLRLGLGEVHEDTAEGRRLVVTPGVVPYSRIEKDQTTRWTVGTLEDALWRMRIGGATDDSALTVLQHKVEVMIPHPELAIGDRAPAERATPPTPAPEPAGRAFRISGFHLAQVVLLLVVVGFFAARGWLS